MKVTIRPSQIRGSIKAIASKSQAHRMLICAAFADRPTEIICRERSLDIDATAGCLRDIGCDITYNAERGSFLVIPAKEIRRTATIDCGESGSTVRFLLPVVCALGIDCKIVMHGRLPERPLSPLWEELIAHGCTLVKNADGTVNTSGKLRGGAFTIAANVSSQFISGLLFAMPLIGAPSTLTLTGNVESESYIRMTMDAQKIFGVDVSWEGDCMTLPADAKYVSPGETEVEGDWSNGAFWLCGAKITKEELAVTGLNMESRQGDRAVMTLKEDIAAGNAVVDAKNVPDLVPVLSVLAAVSPGETTFIHAERLRIKESDRIKTTIELLTTLGAEAYETADGLRVIGRERLVGGTVDSCNDHRIAMSAAIASIACEKDVIIERAEAVRKSYPDFWKDFASLGAEIEIEE